MLDDATETLKLRDTHSCDSVQNNAVRRYVQECEDGGGKESPVCDRFQPDIWINGVRGVELDMGGEKKNKNQPGIKKTKQSTLISSKCPI